LGALRRARFLWREVSRPGGKILFSILGGAAVHRCDNQLGLSRLYRVLKHSGFDFALKGCGFSRSVSCAKSIAALQFAEKLAFRIRASL
jgi:hypothetical protein